MKNILAIFKKELKRFFTDRRMLMALFLPGILMYVMYSVMGNVMGTALQGQAIKDFSYQIVETNNYAEDTTKQAKIDAYIVGGLKTFNDQVTIKYIEPSEVQTYKAKLITNEYHLIISFDDGFELNTSTTEKANISLFYNGSSNESSFVYELTSQMIETVYGTFSVNTGKDGMPIAANVSTKDVTFLRIISVLFPMVLLSLLGSICLSLAPESIAGEKERGTLGLILIAPIKRRELAIGKILALTVTCMASGLVSFVGLILSLPKMFSGISGVSISFGPLNIIYLLFIILSLLLFLISFSSFLSTFAKSVKEANGYLGPLVGLLVFFGIIPAFVDISNIAYSFIPILNAAACLSGIITESITPTFFIITVVSNVVYSAVFGFLMVKMFNNENIMFNVH